MKSGDLVVLKNDFENELEKIGFCGFYAHMVSAGFNRNLLKIAYIRHEDKSNIDFAVFSPFLEVPTQCLELASGKDLIENYKIIKQNSLKYY